MSKKITAASVAALAAVALAGCSNDDSAITQPKAPESSSDTASAPLVPPAGTDLASPQDQAVSTASGTSSSEYGVLDFNQPYDASGYPATLKGKIVLENGIVKSVTVENAKGPTAAFAEGIASAAYGKPVKGLQIDTISGASLTTAAFNEFLKTVK